MNTQTEADAVDTVTLDALELQINETLQTNTAPLKIFYSYHIRIGISRWARQSLAAVTTTGPHQRLARSKDRSRH